MTTKHLWEVDHPYYMTEGNYFSRDCHSTFKSWQDFLSEWENTDLDMNYVVRWDWLEGEDWGTGEFTGDVNYRNGRLMIQIVGQRKAALHSLEIEICRADEPSVIEWLTPRFEYAQIMWEPFGGPAQ